MITAYLENIHQNLLERKQCLEHDIQKLQYEMEEDKQFIRVLDEKTDHSFESFSPRIVNEKNLNKIKELENQIDEKNVSCETLQAELKKVLEDLNECERVIACENQKNDDFQKMKELANRYTVDTPLANKKFSCEEDFLEKIIHQIQFCIDLSIVDSRRNQMELIKIRDELQEYKKCSMKCNERDDNKAYSENEN